MKTAAAGKKTARSHQTKQAGICSYILTYAGVPEKQLYPSNEHYVMMATESTS